MTWPSKVASRCTSQGFLASRMAETMRGTHTMPTPAATLYTTGTVDGCWRAARELGPAQAKLHASPAELLVGTFISAKPYELGESCFPSLPPAHCSYMLSRTGAHQHEHSIKLLYKQTALPPKNS